MATLIENVNRIYNNIKNSLAALSNKGVTVPSNATSDDLVSLINGISIGIDTTTSTPITADTVLKNKVGFANDTKIVGTIESKSAQTLTPTTVGTTILCPSKRYTTGDQKVVINASSLGVNAEKILAGQEILGVIGTGNNGAKFKSGTITVAKGSTYTISGLGFVPDFISIIIPNDNDLSNSSMFGIEYDTRMTYKYRAYSRAASNTCGTYSSYGSPTSNTYLGYFNSTPSTSFTFTTSTSTHAYGTAKWLAIKF